ncbi:MAG: hypothetical protein WBB35_02385 [Saprospiraceae bacterium]
MEENLPNDRFEEFIKESFKDHQADPGDHLWNKINQSLGTVPVSSPGIALKPWAMAIAAAVVLVTISFLTWNNIHLNKQLQQVMEQTARLEQQANTSMISDSLLQIGDSQNRKKNLGSVDGIVVQNQLSTSAQTSYGTAEDQNSAEILVDEPKHDATKDLHLDPRSLGANASEAQNSQNEKLTRITPNGKVGEKLELNEPKSQNPLTNSSILSQTDENLEKLLASKGNKSKDKSKPSSKGINSTLTDLSNVKNAAGSQSTESQLLNASVEANTNPSEQSAYISLEAKSTRREAIIVHTLQFPFSHDIVSQSTSAYVATASTATLYVPQHAGVPKALTLGLAGGPISEKGTLRQTTLPNHSGPQPENSYQAVRSWQSGIGISKYVTKNLTVESGLVLKQYQVMNNISQNLLFGERLQHPGRPSFEHDFGYRIHSPGGIANIEIASEQLDPRATINDTEKINFEINNQSEFQYLSLPLGINFRKSFGKWGLLVGAGVHTNLLIKQEVETKIEVNSSKLKLKKEIEHPKFEKSNLLVFNGLINAGIQYNLASNISVQLTPNIYIPFSNRNRDRDAQYSTRSYGFQLGLNYALGAL